MYVFLVALGGAAGAVSRYLIGSWVLSRTGPEFPWSTFAINVTGSLLIGIVLGIADGGRMGPEARSLLATGLLGGYTTFSTFSYEGLLLLRGGDSGAFLLYLTEQVALGVSAAYLGTAIAKVLT